MTVGFIGLGNTHCGGTNPPTDLVYSDNPAVYVVGTPIAANTPTSSGGAVASYAVNPALPAGLSISGSTGIISGTPTAVSAQASYTVTATNSGGSATVSLSITVNNVAPAGLSYSTNPAVYTVGRAITSNVPTSTGGTIASYAVAPALPAGLALDPTTGIISGTPTAITPTASYVVTASNALGNTTASLSITVNDVPPSITYSDNPAAYTKGVAITANVPTNTGGAVLSYAVSPTLPEGLSLDPTTGVISGTPTTITAAATYTVTANNSGGNGTVGVSIAVNDVAPRALTYSANPAVYTIGTPITSNVPTISGGAVISYSVAPALPAGLSLNTTTGVITGTPTAVATTASYVVTATNSGGSTTDSVSITVKDLPPTTLTYSTNPATYTKGTAITPNTPTNGGGTVISYGVAPALPAGLALSPTTGIISGTPTVVAAMASYTVTATNSGGTTTATVAITVKDVAPSSLVYSTNPVTYTKGAPITPNTPSNAGGTIVSYAVSPALPAGLALSATTGIISGTPTALATAATYTVTGTNTGGSTTVGVNITVNDTPPTNLVYSANPATYTKGTAITPNTPSNSGGAIITYSVSPTLPAGLAISSTTGIISGTPTAITPTASYTVTGTNGVGSTTASVSITVHDAPPANLSYSANPATYTKGVAITSNVPTSSGGAVVSYAVSPALPAGLLFDTTSGIISGTPTAITAMATYTVTATNAGGFTTVGVVITVNDVAPTNLTYSVNPATYTKGAVITNNTPSSGGGPVVSYSVSPALPAGLSLSTTTGVISGTPTAVAAAANYTVTATNTGGNATASVNITVKDIPPTSLTYSTNPATYIKGTAITANTPSNSGGTVVSYGVSPALPAGLSLSTTTGIITGTPTVVLAAATYTVTATNSGGSTTVGLSITVNDVAPTNLTYSVNPATYTKGTLISPNTPSNTGGTPVSYSVSPTLPAGLALSTTTGIITGTPTVVVAAANYTVTATNTAGSTTATVNITVNDAAPTNLTYATNPASFTKGSPITADNPSNTGGTIVTYTVSPALPAGLAISSTTGSITGTPTTVAAAADFVVTGTNTGGSTTVTLNITIKDIPPTGLTYSTNPAVYTVGTAIPQDVPSNSGGAVVSYAVAPALPAGLAISSTTGIISGTPTAVTSAANYTVTATNSGGSTTDAVNITVNVVPATRFAFVANETDNTLSAYTVSATTGLLRANGYVLTGMTPRTVAVHPTGKFVYVANIGANTVSQFSINASSGRLTSITTPIGTGARPFSVTIEPKGRYAYVANFNDSTISAYSISATTGALTSLGTAGSSGGTSPSAIAADPTGRFVYAVNQSGAVAAFSIGGTGTLTAVNSLNAGTLPNSGTVDPTGHFLYVTNQTDGTVSGFTINATSGALTSMGAATPAGTTATAIAVAPSGKFAYVACAGADTIPVFSINSTSGALTAVAGTPAASPNPVTITIDPSGDFAYAANFNTNNVTAYSVNTSTGALALVQTMGARSGATSFALAPGTAPVAYVPKYAYVVNGGGDNLNQYTIGSGGALSPIGATPITTGQGPASVAVDPTNSFAYVANQSDGTVSAYSIGSGGGLTAIGTADAGVGTISVTVDPSAKFVFAANNASGDVTAFTINTDGSLTSVGANVTSGSAPFCIAVDPLGRFAYVTNQSGDSAAAFNINPTTGALTIIGTSNESTGGSPVSVVVDNTGQYVYVANENDATVSTFTIDTTSDSTMGSLSGGTTISTGMAGTANPHSVAVDPVGNFLYVANDGTNDVWTFSIASGGALTLVGTGGIATGTATAPRSVAVDPSGTYVYAANSGGTPGSVTPFTIGPTGALTIGTAVAAGSDPNLIAISGIIQ